jgi:hypothetical protein
VYTDGLSLLGFMSEQEAQRYLTMITNVSPGLAYTHWIAARGRLGDPIPRAGFPEVRSIPDEHQTYLARVPKNPRFSTTVGEMPWSFGLVEIEPLLSHQFHVLIERAEKYRAQRTSVLSLKEALQLCLPLKPEPLPPLQGGQVPNTLNFQMVSGDLGLAVLQVKTRQVKARNALAFTYEVGMRSPFAHVVRFEADIICETATTGRLCWANKDTPICRA